MSALYMTAGIFIAAAAITIVCLTIDAIWRHP